MEKRLNTKVTCPYCGYVEEVVMPIDSCQIFYKCKNCSKLLKPKKGDCCVFCSYGDIPCPPKQIIRQSEDKMKPTEILKEEHRVIKSMLKVLDKICNKLSKNKEVDVEHLEKIVDFIRTFADKCHHGKEEDLLFVSMEKAGIPKEGGPIGVMLEEHEIGRGYVRSIAEAISKYKSGNKKSSSEIIKNAQDYIQLLTQHIDKEDNILYMMADMHLSDDEQKRLIKEFEKVEQKKIGKGVHEKYHHLVKELERVYL